MTKEHAPSEWYIAGAGAIGMSLAHRLHERGSRVTLITNSPQTDEVELSYEHMGSDAVRWSCPVATQPDGHSIERLVVASKAHAVTEIVTRWSPSLVDGARIYFLQNGIGFIEEGMLPSSVQPIHVVNAGFTAFKRSKWHAVQTATEPVWAGSGPGGIIGSMDVIEADMQVLEEAEFKARWTDDIDLHRWEKIGINAIVNALAVIHDCENGQLLESLEASTRIRAMCDELGLLFQAMDLELTADRLHESTLSVLQSTARNICSTLQDHRSGSGRHELDYINLALLEEAGRLGVEMPVQEQVYTEVVEAFGRVRSD